MSVARSHVQRCPPIVVLHPPDFQHPNAGVPAGTWLGTCTLTSAPCSKRNLATAVRPQTAAQWIGHQREGGSPRCVEPECPVSVPGQHAYQMPRRTRACDMPRTRAQERTFPDRNSCARHRLQFANEGWELRVQGGHLVDVVLGVQQQLHFLQLPACVQHTACR